jgi:uncharacterized RDD family membrane protein YckC
MSPITILDQANVPMGPFTREQVLEKLQRGEVTLSSLAFVEGLSQWTPLRDVMGRVESAAPAVPVSTVAPTMRPPATSSAAVYSYAATMQPPAHYVYAGFWLRFVAIFIDGLILAPLTVISVLLQWGMKSTTTDSDSGLTALTALVLFGYAVVAFILRWLYFSLMESSPWQATVGKKVLGLRVTGLDGGRIGFGRATGRYFGKIISSLTLFIGFIMAGFTERKQALHDMIAGTLVVRD